MPRILLLLCLALCGFSAGVEAQLGLHPGPVTAADITLAGDVTGLGSANTVAKINGVTLGTTTATSGNLLIGSGAAWVTNALTGDATITSGGVLSLANNATARGNLGVSIEQAPLHAQVPQVTTYYLIPATNYALTVNNLYIATVSGTATVAVKINGTSITGLTAVSVTSTPQTVNATALNTMVAGDTLTLVVSAIAAPVDMFANVKLTR